MAATTTPAETHVAETTTTPSLQFQYDDEQIEVIIIDNGEEDRDGYVELSAAVRLISPIATIRNFNKAVMWTNVLPCQKLTRNNKNYVHVNALCKYLFTYNLANAKHPHQYYVLKRLIGDLIVGAQSQIVDPIHEIKTQLCTLQECLTGNQLGSDLQQQQHQTVFQPTTSRIHDASPSWSESFREIVRHENNAVYTNVMALLDHIKNVQVDLTNKLAFSNDTMLDNFKSLKDIIIRKK
ncbi:p24 [Orgyia leucostigma nucleopolyhedrovirus]|uniref:p24 n=1 Tax=Orgyia leucostigma nucleopolyhedrovirus TaxID=490711 RepID=B0FDY4_9ABAC|nr:p24 [Orgyia leucostigma nucleopolyhedrovirus]ABY65842.1 p24 [Orgyia leucostigma nucleopolyhedrovirus]